MDLSKIERNCYHCGLEYRAASKETRICDHCRKPRVRGPRIISRLLTLRQKQIVDLIILGTPNKLIAYKLHLRESTIKVYLSAIFEKTGLGNRTELAVWGMTQRLGLPVIPALTV